MKDLEEGLFIFRPQRGRMFIEIMPDNLFDSGGVVSKKDTTYYKHLNPPDSKTER